MTIDRLAAHFSRFGVVATWTPADYTAGGTGLVIYDAQGESMLGGAVQSIGHEVLYRATEFVGMETGDELALNGTCYTVRNIESVDDGQLKRATLSEIIS